MRRLGVSVDDERKGRGIARDPIASEEAATQSGTPLERSRSERAAGSGALEPAANAAVSCPRIGFRRSSPAGRSPLPMDSSHRTLGPYDLIATLGEGGGGRVLRARHRTGRHEVALKVIPLPILADPSVIGRYRREARLGAKLEHPHIVRTRDCGEDGGFQWIALDLVEGGDLERRLRERGALPPAEALRIVRDLMSALVYAHGQGIIHRDIKPSNILFEADGTVKLADFGLAKDIAPESTQLTRTGSAMGTPNYLSPEQARSAKHVDARSDLYSLGATLYHMLAGRPPFDGESPYEVAMRRLTEDPPPPSRHGPGVPPAVDSLVLRWMAREPSGRPASAAEAREELERLLGAGPESSGGSRLPADVLPAARAAAFPRRRAVRTWSVAAVGLAALGWLGVWIAAQFHALPQQQDRPSANAPAAEPWVDLLPGVDPERDAVVGSWTRTAEGVRSDDASFARLQLGQAPAAEYDFEVIFSVAADDRDGFGQGEVFQVFTGGPGSGYARWAMWYYDFTWFGFVHADSEEPNRTGRNDLGPLVPGVRYLSRIEIRAGRVRAFLDDRLAGEWTAPDWAASRSPTARLRDPDRLGIGAYRTRVTFHRVAARPHRPE